MRGPDSEMTNSRPKAHQKIGSNPDNGTRHLPISVSYHIKTVLSFLEL